MFALALESSGAEEKALYSDDHEPENGNPNSKTVESCLPSFVCFILVCCSAALPQSHTLLHICILFSFITSFSFILQGLVRVRLLRWSREVI